MNKKFEEPMINVYNFRHCDIATEGLSTGYNDNKGEGEITINELYKSNYITVKGGLDENIPL